MLLAPAVRAEDREDLYRAAHEGADREVLADKWGKVKDEHGRAMARLYRLLVREDKAFREPKELRKLSGKAQAAYWLYRLRDLKLTRMQTRYQGPMFLDWPRGNALDKLTEIGWEAIPLLIEHLDDPRPTRSVDEYHTFRGARIQGLFTYGELCRMGLRRVSGVWFDRTHNARIWWKEAKKRGAELFYRTRLRSGPGRAFAASQLARIDPDKYLPVIVGRLGQLDPDEARNVLNRITDHFKPSHKRSYRMLMTGDSVHRWAVAASLVWKHEKSDVAAGALVALMRKKPDDPAVGEAVARLAGIPSKSARKLLLGLVLDQDKRKFLRTAAAAHVAADVKLFEELLGLAEGKARLAYACAVGEQTVYKRAIASDDDVKRFAAWMKTPR